MRLPTSGSKSLGVPALGLVPVPTPPEAVGMIDEGATPEADPVLVPVPAKYGS